MSENASTFRVGDTLKRGVGGVDVSNLATRGGVGSDLADREPRSDRGSVQSWLHVAQPGLPQTLFS